MLESHILQHLEGLVDGCFALFDLVHQVSHSIISDGHVVLIEVLLLVDVRANQMKELDEHLVMIHANHLIKLHLLIIIRIGRVLVLTIFLVDFLARQKAELLLNDVKFALVVR